MKQGIHSHKTAIGRHELSRPMRLALDAKLLTQGASVFDYGCGRGDDLLQLEHLGFSAVGWDPAHRPHTPQVSADVVNLGYVVNVIENPGERRAALQSAWRLARQLLIVAARLHGERDLTRATSLGDGYLTRRGTFQKFFSQIELRDWINETLGEQAIAAAPGVFFIFRDEAVRQRFLASRFRQIRTVPAARIRDRLYEKHQDLLRPLIEFVTERGRLPETDELAIASALETHFGSIRKAFALIRRVTGPGQWELIRKEREQELLIYLALDRFRGRARFSQLPTDMQLDIRDFFSSYSRACEMADALLFSAGNLKELNRAMQKSNTGKLTAEALYVHVDAISRLDTCLRIYEGCARGYLGLVEGANIVKLHRQEPMVSYLSYPDFDTIPHPALIGSLSLKLSNASVRYLDYSSSENPPILHRKEEFLAPDDPRREKFYRLTKQEERQGLFTDSTIIGTQSVWAQLLRLHGVRLRGHQLIRDKSVERAGAVSRA